MGYDGKWKGVSLKTEVSVPLKPEVIVDNEWFLAQFVRQLDGRLQGHVTYKKWSAEAKRESIKVLDSFDEPIYGAIRTQKLMKYLLSLGFELTGRVYNCEYPGEEGTIMSEAVYIKGGVDKYCLASYEEEGKYLLPFSELDGYGKIEKLDEALAKIPSGEWTTNHYFSDGVYTRETLVPRGLLFTGYRHRRSTNTTIAFGIISIIVVDELGRAEDKGLIDGYTTFVTKANTRKACYAHEDTMMLNSFDISGLPIEFHNVENISMVEDFIFDKGVSV